MAVSSPIASPTETNSAAASEKQGRRWLIWSFIFCPCHLPLSMAVLAAIFGGSAFGTLISRNTMGVGIAFGIIYAIGVGIGLRHIRRATAGADCSGTECVLPDQGALTERTSGTER